VDYEKGSLLLKVFLCDCRFGRSQRCIGDKTAHAPTFDFGSLINQLAFLVSEVNESLFPEG